MTGGAIASPQILMCSGIGPKEHLEEHGIEVISDLPCVGENLQDHPAAVVSYKTPKRASALHPNCVCLERRIQFQYCNGFSSKLVF